MERKSIIPRVCRAAALVMVMAGGQQAMAVPYKVLVFSKTAGFRHDSIPNGISAIQALGASNNFTVDATEDANNFNAGNLAQYAAVIFLNTTGDVLNATQQTAFEQYIQSGKGYVGIHSASDTEYGWAWYGGLVGAYFSNHPAIQMATVKVADRAHPSTSGLPKLWQRSDEWYNFNINPRGTVHVLATLNEGTYSGGTMGYDHPIAWCHDYDGGRAWYTGGGHTQASFSETLFRAHLLGGIQYAAGAVDCDCGATLDANFQKVVLDANTTNPLELSVAPDGRVFFIERTGAVKIYRPQSNTTVQALQLSVTTSNEDGLLGITLDPNFANNQWVYLFYSPAAFIQQRLSRFTASGDTLNPSSEQILLTIPTQRDQCCHSAGSLTFGGDGNLYLSTGDNTNPFDSSGYTPIDERAGRSAWDAQKSSSNRNDLRGKILRITPQAGGTYTIPPGNLFPQDGSNGRPEVYVMGCRNPFRIAVDSVTGWLYWGEVGPDANSASSSRGPAGLDEFNQARAAGNFGWPYCIGTNSPYKDYNFATGISGLDFNCASPVNDSPNNTGSLTLPAAQAALIYYPYSASTTFPELSTGGRTGMSGPIYHYNPNLSSAVKLPAYYDNTWFIFEWSRNWIKEIKLDDSGNVLKINPFLPSFTFSAPIEMEVGPDGAIYMIEYASGNSGCKLVRIEYLNGESLSPVAVASGQPTSGPVPLLVQFSSAGSYDPDPGDTISYAWDFTYDGSIDSTAPNPSFTYTAAGNYTAKLTVTDQDGKTGYASVPISAGNSAPVVTIVSPPEGGIYNWGDRIAYQVSVTDAEDGSTQGGTISCSNVTVGPLIGHDQHSHPLTQANGCTGTLNSPANTGHSDEDYLYLWIEGSYTDTGAPGVAPLTGTGLHRLQPKLMQAEFYSAQSGVTVQGTADSAGGAFDISTIDHSDYLSFTPVNLSNITAVCYRTASAGMGGFIDVHTDSVSGPLISTAGIAPTGSWQSYAGTVAPISDPGGTHTLYFVFRRNPGDMNLFNLNWIDFVGTGVAAAPTGIDTVTIDLGSPDVQNNMTNVPVSDGDTVVSTVGGRTCRRNDNASQDFYIYFAVADSYTFQGNKPAQYITVEYYDTGSGALELQYDSSTGTGIPAQYRVGGSVGLTNSNTWKRTMFSVTDAYFGNRQNNGADFRISKSGGGFFYLDRLGASTLSELTELGIAPALVDRTVQKGQPVPTDSFEITNLGGGTANYAITGLAGWFTLLPTSGSSTGEPDTFTIAYNTTGLPTGNYSATLIVTDANAINSPQSIPVSFHYLAAGDFDDDGDVDQVDFGIFQPCITGSSVPVSPPCEEADLNDDTHVDTADFNLFLPCMGGADKPPGC